MAKPMVKEINCETGEELEREMTVAEEKVFIADNKARALEIEEAKSLAQAKADALAALGLTQEQLQALLS